ncbi:hypothetical protein [Endozoicomonas sp.]|uniref:hypothetical protein n=1 Tax=Endozoicomonas sp. TaxID=1892382 RepID=UPI002886A219|nr:hypothetical protein [Endozoicomonas sp.]
MTISGSYTSLPTRPTETHGNQDKSHTGCFPPSRLCRYTRAGSINSNIPERSVFIKPRKSLHKYYIKPTAEKLNSLDEFIQYAENNSSRSLRKNICKWLNSKRAYQLISCFPDFRTNNKHLKEQFYTLLVEKCHKELFDCDIEMKNINENEAESIANGVFDFLKVDQSTSAPLSLDKAKAAHRLSKVYTLTRANFLRTDISQIKRSMQLLISFTIELEPLINLLNEEELFHLMSHAKNAVDKSLNAFMFEEAISSELQKIFQNQCNIEECDHDRKFKIPKRSQLQLVGQSTSNLIQIRLLKEAVIKHLMTPATQEKTQSVTEDVIRTIPISILRDMMLKTTSQQAEDEEPSIKTYYDAGRISLNQLKEHEKKLKNLASNLYLAILAAVNQNANGRFIKSCLAVETFSPCLYITEDKDGRSELAINPVFLEYPPQAALDKINGILSKLDTNSEWYLWIKSTFDSNKDNLCEYVVDWNSQDEKIKLSTESLNELHNINESINMAKKLFFSNLTNIRNMKIHLKNRAEQLNEYRNKVIDRLNSLIQSKQSRLAIQPAAHNTSLDLDETGPSIPEGMGTTATDNEDRVKDQPDRTEDHKEQSSSFKKNICDIKRSSKRLAIKAGHGIKEFSSQIQGHTAQITHAVDDFHKIEVIYAQIKKVGTASTVQEVRNLVQELINMNLFKKEERKAQLQDILNLPE